MTPAIRRALDIAARWAGRNREIGDLPASPTLGRKARAGSETSIGAFG
jgi:hypothetical protein